MSKVSKKSQDMTIEDILKSVKGVINERKNLSNEDEDILELTEIIDQDEEELISTQSAEKVNDILKDFTSTIKDKNLDNNVSSKNALEELVIEMLKPELKTWLDKNLPLLVKELVESEIKKLVQNSRK
ncbi:MAG TPA: PopZ family protein [Rickettsia endosymbiont of Columbicola hoogstraali]|nr:PopZ family protein [Rickettsia endosymbiont of Columbicola hoogstraali]